MGLFGAAEAEKPKLDVRHVWKLDLQRRNVRLEDHLLLSRVQEDAGVVTKLGGPRTISRGGTGRMSIIPTSAPVKKLLRQGVKIEASYRCDECGDFSSSVTESHSGAWKICAECNAAPDLLDERLVVLRRDRRRRNRGMSYLIGPRWFWFCLIWIVVASAVFWLTMNLLLP